MDLHLLALIKKFSPAYGIAYGKPWDRLELKTTSQGYKQFHIPPKISRNEFFKGLELIFLLTYVKCCRTQKYAFLLNK